ncbi:hypothetical protein F0358_15115 [Empedobacter brevis]|uniref:tetratricopeptide repeat protein n=1 Tax=Empedobacter brevis TaxID=247 RepID=UPI00123CCD4B|nr:hypothetical protein [Empedobacter brevis]QES93951.1 hypothetical protein F0358_15115 [Empedobacter brevis]
MKFPKILILIFLTLHQAVFCQSESIKNIENNIKKINHQNAYKNYNTEQLLQLTTEVYAHSKDINYKEGQLKAQMKFLQIYFNTGNVDGVIQMFPETQITATELDDNYSLARAMRYYAWAMTKIGNYDEALSTLKKTKDLSKQLKNDEQKIVLMNVNSSLSSYYEAKNLNVDSMLIHSQIAYKYATLLDSNYQGRDQAIAGTANVLGNIFVYKNDLANGKKFIKIALNHYEKTEDEAILAKIYKSLGSIYLKENNNSNAIYYFSEAITLSKKSNQTDEVMNILPMLSSAYQGAGQYKEASNKLNEYKALDDSIKSNIKNLNNKMYKKNAVTNDTLISKKLLLAIIIFLIVLSAILYYKNKKVKSYRDTVSIEAKKNTYNQEVLDFSINAVDELSKLAKENEQAFYTGFLEVFPDFKNNLLERYPNLSKADLRLAAYLKMNFDTKEISAFTNSTIKSVEGKKYRFRKKVELHKDQDLYTFISQF